MQIKVNGEIRNLESHLSVLQLTQLLELNPKQVAIERNGAIVPRSTYGEVALMENDQIEIVQFIGGG